MKKMYVAMLVVAIVMLSAGMAMAGISSTKHNLSSSASWTIKGDIAEICVYCHTPHGGDTTIPLWNRAAGTMGVTPYSSASMSVGMPNFVSGVSRACFTCHDGLTAVNTLVNYQGAAKPGGGANTTVSGFSNLGTDMTNDHPVGVPMIPAISAGYTDPGTTGTDARTFGATHTVECASCHDVHGAGQILFLRASNAESAICMACHNK